MEAESDKGEVFDDERIRRLVELMKEHDLQELDLRLARDRLRIKRNPGVLPPAGYPGGYVAPALAPAPPPPPSATPAATPATAAESGEPQDASIVLIKSPMVGTFYSKPNPKAAQYVKVGDHVDADTTVCIIEAMKVFNEIPAEVSGRIVAQLVDNEEPVEFGKPLFKVDTRG